MWGSALVRLRFYGAVLKGGWTFLGRLSDHRGRLLLLSVPILALGGFGALTYAVGAASRYRWVFWVLVAVVGCLTLLEGAYQVRLETSASEGAPSQAGVGVAAAQAIPNLPPGREITIEHIQTVTGVQRTVVHSPAVPTSDYRQRAASLKPEFSAAVTELPVEELLPLTSEPSFAPDPPDAELRSRPAQPDRSDPDLEAESST